MKDTVRIVLTVAPSVFIGLMLAPTIARSITIELPTEEGLIAAGVTAIAFAVIHTSIYLTKYVLRKQTNILD